MVTLRSAKPTCGGSIPPQASMCDQNQVTLDLYEHYQGNVYKVLAVGRSSETLEPLVVYQAQYESKKFGKNAVWVRPLSMFQEVVTHKGMQVPRFRKIEM